jgi:hypothetical protein
LTPSTFAQGTDYDLESDLTIGYSFLFGDAGDAYYRNHQDITEGFLLDRYRFALSPKKEGHWFDQLRVDLSIANRDDSSKGLDVRFLKHGTYEARIKYSYLYDFFSDPYYNYGQTDRNLARDDLDFDFKWESVPNLVLDFGYGLLRVNDDFSYSTFNWGENFKIPIRKDLTQQEVRVGAEYSRSGFLAGFSQSWYTLEDTSPYQSPTSAGAGLGLYDVDISHMERSQAYESDIPVSTARLGYAGGRFSTDLVYVYGDGSLDLDYIDLKEFVFVDMNSRNEILLKAAGTGNLPEHNLDFRIDADVTGWLGVEYRLGWQNLKSESNIDLTDTMRLFPTSGPPLEFTDAYGEADFYQNRSVAHTVEATVRPADGLAFTAGYRRIDGDLTHTLSRDAVIETDIDDEYSRDTYELRGKYRLEGGTELRGFYRYETIDDPTYRTAGHTRSEFQVGLTQPLADSFNIHLSFRDSRLEDDRVSLDNRARLVDLAVDYSPRAWATFGLGYTLFDYDYRIGMDYAYTDYRVTPVEEYDAAQNGLYAYAGFEGNSRVKGGLSFYFLDDSGASYPLSRFSGQANVEVGVYKDLSVLVAGRYFDYQEDLFAGRDYSYNQLIVALRWIVK